MPIGPNHQYSTECTEGSGKTYPNSSRRSFLVTANPRFLIAIFFLAEGTFVAGLISAVPCLANFISNFRPSRTTPAVIAALAISLLSNVTNPNPIDNFSPFELVGLTFNTASLNPGNPLNAFVKPVCVVEKSRFLTYKVAPGSSTSVGTRSLDPFLASTPEIW